MKKLPKTLLLFFVSMIYINCFGQKKINDSMFIQFEKCMKDYYSAKYRKYDTSIFCFYGSKDNIILKEFVHAEGKLNYYQMQKEVMVDSLNILGVSDIRFFDREINYEEFINFILARNENSTCIFPKQKSVWLFMSCTEENWAQFYFDKIIYKNNLYLTPIVEIIISDGKKVTHQRELLICRYNIGSGFLIEKVHVIRKNIVCN